MWVSQYTTSTTGYCCTCTAFLKSFSYDKYCVFSEWGFCFCVPVLYVCVAVWKLVKLCKYLWICMNKYEQAWIRYFDMCNLLNIRPWCQQWDDQVLREASRLSSLLLFAWLSMWQKYCVHTHCLPTVPKSLCDCHILHNLWLHDSFFTQLRNNAERMQSCDNLQKFEGG